MALIFLLSWWYGRGWVWIVKGTIHKIEGIAEAFSVGILIRTLFAPWKQIQSEKTLQNFLQSTLDNFISRFIGACVRTVMLLTAIISIIGISVGGLAAIIIWPIFPALIVVMPIVSYIKVGA
jgi:small-conductance mechanosensitive channel